VIGPLQQAGLCRLTPQPTSSGLWTIYMGHEGGGGGAAAAAAAAMMQPATSPQPPPMAMQQQQQHRPASAAGGAADHQQQQPELQLLQLRKASDSMGLSIVAARGTGQQQLGIYIKSVVKGGSADLDGRLQAGDQLLSVDGYSLVGITQDRAAEILMRTSHTVRLEVARQAAMYHGLATLLSQPSPPNSAHTSRSTLSLNKIPMDGPSLSAQQQRGGVPSSAAAAISGSGMRPPQQSQSYQERLVDWDRPSHQQMMMTSSNSMGELASVQQQQQQPARPPSSTGMRQQSMTTATSRSVSALHDQQQQHAAEASFAAQQQQQHQQMMQRQQMMGNQRAVSAQHLVPPQQQQQQQQRHSGTVVLNLCAISSSLFSYLFACLFQQVARCRCK